MSSTPTPTPEVRLREERDDDLDALYEMQAAPGWTEMAGIARRDRDEFDAFRSETATEPGLVRLAIEVDGVLAGEVLSRALEDGRRIVGYGVLESFWGRGIASAALALLLEEVSERPLYATVLPGNLGSRRVLERSGFTLAEERDEDVLYMLA